VTEGEERGMESPGHLRMSLAAAMTLGFKRGLFYRDARLYCIPYSGKVLPKRP